MSPTSNSKALFAPLLVAALLGGGVAAGVTTLLENNDGGSDGHTTTVIRQPAMAAELAAAIWSIAAHPPEERAGAWHLMGAERLSRCDIARRAARDLGVAEDLVRGEPTPPGLVRPRDLHLADDRARRTIGWHPRPVFGGS